MSLIDDIEDELKQAILARDDDRRDALRLILSSLRSAEKELQRPLSEDEELQVLQRERKRRLEAAEAFRAARPRGAGRGRRRTSSRCSRSSCPSRSRRTSSRDRRRRDRRGRRHVHARSRSRDGGCDAAGLRSRRRLHRQPARPREARVTVRAPLERARSGARADGHVRRPGSTWRGPRRSARSPPRSRADVSGEERLISLRALDEVGYAYAESTSTARGRVRASAARSRVQGASRRTLPGGGRRRRHAEQARSERGA